MIHKNAYDIDSEDEEKRMPDYQNFLKQNIENEETENPSNHNIHNNNFEHLENEIHNYVEEYQNNNLLSDSNNESDAEYDYDTKKTEILKES